MVVHSLFFHKLKSSSVVRIHTKIYLSQHCSNRFHLSLNYIFIALKRFQLLGDAKYSNPQMCKCIIPREKCLGSRFVLNFVKILYDWKL